MDCSLTGGDFDSAFVQGLTDRRVFMDFPATFDPTPAETRLMEEQKCVLQLNKCLYGLKQAGRQWYLTIKKWLVNYGFTCMATDTCVFTLHKGGEHLIVWLYVDDIGVICSNDNLLEQFYGDLCKAFRFTKQGNLEWYIGIKITRDKNKVTLDQEKYITECLEDLGLAKINPVTTPGKAHPKDQPEPCQDPSYYRKLVGKLVYLATCTRPDIAFTVQQLSQNFQNPTMADQEAAIRCWQYIKYTKGHKLCYSGENFSLLTYSDTDWATSKTDRKSIGGFVIMLLGAVVAWRCKKQTVVALSTAEAEYMGLCLAVQELLWLDMFLNELGIKAIAQAHPLEVLGDNQASLKMVQEGADNSRTKHIDIKYHFLKDLVRTNRVNITYVDTKFNLADLLTKPKPKGPHMEDTIRVLGMKK